MTSEAPAAGAPAPASPLLEVRDLGHRYRAAGRGRAPDQAPAVLEALSFSVRPAELTCIVGPSGCGKTTLLRCVSGLLTPSGGTVTLAGEPVLGVPDGIAIVFQDYSRSLLPWLRVAGNVDFPLSRHGLSKQDRRQRVRDSLAAVGLEEVADRHPWQLSGGMQQRVAIARALAYRPRLLLMDEPFASVDAQTRADLEDLVLEVRDRFKMTVLFVTHDIDESVYLGDRVLVLSRSPGRLVAEIRVGLPHPRDQIATKELDEFVRLRAEVGRLVRSRRAVGVP
jgi:NitT/TauT family transport system ATP-binding protein